MHRLRFTPIPAILLIFSLFAGSVAVSAQSASPEAAVDSVAPQLPVTVTDVEGNQVTVTDVSRIVSLNGNITEILFALGLGANVVAVDVTAFYPPEAAALPKIGYNRTLSAESILSFEPTLIIGNQEAGPVEVIQQLRDSGVPVVMLSWPTAPTEAATQIEDVAAAVGLAGQGDALAAHVNDQLAAAQALVEQSEMTPRVAFLIIRGEGVQLIAGAHSGADGIVAAAGGINVGTELGLQGYAPITPEAMISAAPDVIVVLQDGLAASGGLDALLQIPGISETPAAENGNILAFNDLYILGFGPRMGDAVFDLAVALHPDVDAQPVHPEWEGTDVQPLSTPTH